MKNPPYLYLFLFFCVSTYNYADLAYVTNDTVNTVSVIDTATNTVIDVIGGFQTPNDIAITPNNQFALVSNVTDQTLEVIETTTNTVIQTILLSKVSPTVIAITPNGQFAYVGFIDFPCTVDQISIPGFNVTQVTVSPNDIVSAATAITPDGQFAFITTDIADTVFVLNTSTNVTTATIPLGNVPNTIVISPDGNAYVGNEADGTVSVINTTTLAVSTLTLPLASTGVKFLAVRPNAHQVYVTYFDAAGFAFINTIDTLTNTVGTQQELSPNDSEIHGMAFSTGGGLLYLTDFNHNEVLVMNPDTFMIEATISVNSPDGIAIAGTPSPQNLQGRQLKNDCGLEYELFNLLQWQPSTAGASGYRVYRNGGLIATVGPDTLTYRDHNRKKGTEYQYSITALSIFGESVPLTITVP